MLCTIGIIAGDGGPPPAGTLLSTYCASTSGVDNNYIYWDGAWESMGVYADGIGGTYNQSRGFNSNGCYHPAGWTYSTSQNDANLSWYNGTNSGYFYAGYTYNYEQADGSGGVYSGGGIYAPYPNGYIIDEYNGPDNVTGLLTRFIARLKIEDNWFYVENVQFTAAGVIINEYCNMIDNETDANGTVWTVMARFATVADGNGGTYESVTANTPQCGYYPSGFYIAFSQTDLEITYSDQYAMSQTFVYGDVVYQDIANGTGGSDQTTTPTIYYSAGYVFYGYYDEVNNYTVSYIYDGGSGYSTYYS